jgi:hypothetical protein
MPPMPATPEIQTCAISVPLGHDPKAGTALHDLCSAGPGPQGLHSPVGAPFCPPKPCMISALPAMPPTPATPEIQTCAISVPLGHDPKAGTALHDLCSAGPGPQGLHSPAQYSLCKTVPLRPAKPGTHRCTISILLDHAPPSLSSGESTDMQDLYSAGLHPSGMPSPHYKACYFTSAKGLHP